MKVIEARNVNDAFQKAINYLNTDGIQRNSRNGPVLVSPVPVTTVYYRPWERVLFLPERDANPFFHLYESLWMLAGRNDIAPLTKFVKRMGSFSDDGVTQHGAYGKRWRLWFGRDQLTEIIAALRKNHDDRRCVLQMWDTRADLGRNGKDVPCNLTATFQVNHSGNLDLVVFCRSNDIVWGAYGANAVHFSFLLEYMAIAIGVPMGRYYQVSVNWHGYLETFEPLNVGTRLDSQPYDRVTSLPMGQSQQEIDNGIAWIMDLVDEKYRDRGKQSLFFQMAGRMMSAHLSFKRLSAPERFDSALYALGDYNNLAIDWVRAAQEWIERRRTAWERKDGNHVKA